MSIIALIVLGSDLLVGCLFFFFPSATASMTATQLTESGKNQFLLLSLQIPNFRHAHIHFSSLKKILFKEVVG